MSVYELCLIAILASLEYIAFIVFSNILYLEVITFLVLLITALFSRKVAFFSSLIFAFLLILINGFNFWNGLYLIIYPSYSLLLSCLKNLIYKHRLLRSILCAFLSFLTGQILQLPYLLVAKEVTIYYLLAGFKTSFVQGVISGILCYSLFDVLYAQIERMKR